MESAYVVFVPAPAIGESNFFILVKGSIINVLLFSCFKAVFRIRIHTDPHKEMPPGSGSGSRR